MRNCIFVNRHGRKHFCFRVFGLARFVAENFIANNFVAGRRGNCLRNYQICGTLKKFSRAIGNNARSLVAIFDDARTRQLNDRSCNFFVKSRHARRISKLIKNFSKKNFPLLKNFGNFFYFDKKFYSTTSTPSTNQFIFFKSSVSLILSKFSQRKFPSLS